MKFYTEKDLENGNFEKGWAEIEKIREGAKMHRKMLAESVRPKFRTLEEFAKYYNAIPFSEWENKMKEKYGL